MSPQLDQLDRSSEYWNDDMSGSALLTNLNVPYELVDCAGGVAENEGTPGGRPFSYHHTVLAGYVCSATLDAAEHCGSGTTRTDNQ